MSKPEREKERKKRGWETDYEVGLKIGDLDPSRLFSCQMAVGRRRINDLVRSSFYFFEST